MNGSAGEVRLERQAGAANGGDNAAKQANRLLPLLHVSADFPDPIDSAKTPVIRSLLELTHDRFDHQVISLNRQSPRLRDLLSASSAEATRFEWGEAKVYRAPPRGLWHATFLRRLGRQLAESLASAPPALLIGHKLTIEGVAVAEAAKLLRVPFAITIQGNTDTKILAARPDLAAAFSRIFHEAAVVFAFAPWTLSAVEARLGKRVGRSILLPCPTDLDTIQPPVLGGERLLSAFNLRHFRNKNLAGIATALRHLQAEGRPVPFALIGGGEKADVARCETALRGVPDHLLTGQLDRNKLARTLNSGIGFVLPSHRESFGLVFLEALFAGLPVIYPQGRAISGWFDDFPFAVPIDPADPKAIAMAIRHVIDEEAALKQSLACWQKSEHARQFMRPQIAEIFSAAVEGAAENAIGGCI